MKSSNHVTNWVGTVWIMPAAGAYIADAYLGRYSTFLIASAIYLLVCMKHLDNYNVYIISNLNLECVNYISIIHK